MDQARSDIAHLYRRVGFGSTAAELDAAAAAGFEATVDSLLATDGPDPGGDSVAVPQMTPPSSVTSRDPGALQALRRQLQQEAVSLVNWWVQRMVVTSKPLTEKLALVWHDHFATSVVKVRFPALMYRQNQIFRTMGSGAFDTLTQTVAADPAMLIWLDAAMDKKADPNENFARELMERFTMGLGTYTEEDVREAARAFTGWAYNRRDDSLVVVPGQHDAGVKQVLGSTGTWTGQDVINIVTHNDASHRFVTASLWSHLAYPVAPDHWIVSELAPSYAADLNVGQLLGAILRHPEFRSQSSRLGLVKQPVEYVVGTLRALSLPPEQAVVVPVLAGLGQVPFSPPNVGGWPQNEYWLSTASSLARWRFASYVARRSDLSAVADELPGQRVDAVAHLLGVDGWSSATSGALARVADRPSELVTLALVSPEYVAN